MARTPKLTKRTIDALATDLAGGLRVYDGTLCGFGVHVLPSGRKSFFQDYTAPWSRRRRRLKLGSYGEITLEQAKDERRQVLAKVRRGIDPLEERKLEREAGNLSEWVARYLELGQAAGRWADRSFVEVARHLKRRVAAVHELCEALEAVSRGLWGDLRAVADDAAEIAADLARLRGPEVTP